MWHRLVNENHSQSSYKIVWQLEHASWAASRWPQVTHHVHRDEPSYCSSRAEAFDGRSVSCMERAARFCETGLPDVRQLVHKLDAASHSTHNSSGSSSKTHSTVYVLNCVHRDMSEKQCLQMSECCCQLPVVEYTDSLWLYNVHYVLQFVRLFK